MDFIADVGAPIVVGIVLAVVIECVRWTVLWPRRRRERRRQIVGLLSRVNSIVYRAHERRRVESGDWDLQWRPPIEWLPAELVNEIDRLTWEALQLFRGGEYYVAEWTQIEFAAAVNAGPDEDGFWKAPRHHMLMEWADHNQNPPFYAWADGVGDTYRHDMLPPNSDAGYALMIDAPNALKGSEALPLLERWKSRRAPRRARRAWGSDA